MEITVHSIRQVHSCLTGKIVVELRCQVEGDTLYQIYRRKYYKTPPLNRDKDIQAHPYYAAHNFASAMSDLMDEIRRHADAKLFVGYLVNGSPHELYEVTFCEKCHHHTVRKL